MSIKIDKDKVACQFCGKEYSKAGIVNHEKACQENPENKVTEEVKEVEIELVVEEPKIEVKQPKLVTIKLADKVECYIGDRYYRFKKGDVAEVPENVKEVLKRAGLLEAI